MILVCTGTQKFQFNRLIEATDKLIRSGVLSGEVVVQAGYSDFIPGNCRCSRFYDREEMDRLTDEAELIITHGGSGSIMNALQKGKKVIAVPRLSRYGEHINDHQLQLVKLLSDEGYIEACEDPSGLEEAVKKALHQTYRTYTGSKGELTSDIASWIGDVL